MKLSEAQSKALLARYGVPSPPSRVLTDPVEVEAAVASLALPLFVKAQVPVANRASRGLVVEGRRPEEVYAAVTKLLGHREGRWKVEELLLEKAVPAEDLLYVAVTVDGKRRRPILLAGRDGGSGVEERIEPSIYELPCLKPWPPWLGLRTASDLGYRGELAAGLAKLLSGLLRAFFDCEALLVEVNPLALGPGGWTVLDARIELDDDALYRHPDLTSSGPKGQTELEAAAEAVDRLDGRGVAGRLVEFDGDLGLLIGGGGASLTVFDAVLDAGLTPANYCEIGGNPTVRKVAALTKLILSKPSVRYLAVIMNVVSNTRADLIARGVLKGILEAGRDPAETLVAFRVPGSWEAEAALLLSSYGLRPLDRETPLDLVPYLIRERILRGEASG